MLTNAFAFGPNNRVLDAPIGSRLSLSFTTSTGQFRGSVVDTNSRTTISYSGVVLQDEQVGRGYFLRASVSGGVVIQADE